MPRLAIICLALMVGGAGNAPAFIARDATSVDCCRCEDRYSGDLRITWYTSALTCEKQPSRDLNCQRIRVAGRTCESTRWVPGPEGLTCQPVNLQSMEAGGKLRPVVVSGMTPCQANKTLQAMRAASLALAEAGALAANTAAGPGSLGGAATFCSCERDPREHSHCALFRSQGGHAAILDSRPLPEGANACDRPTCSQLFVADHATHCPVYYQGPPAMTARAD